VPSSISSLLPVEPLRLPPSHQPRPAAMSSSRGWPRPRRTSSDSHRRRRSRSRIPQGRRARQGSIQHSQRRRRRRPRRSRAAGAARPGGAEMRRAAPVGRIGQRPRASGPELAVEAVDRARGGEHASDEGLQLGAGAPGGDDLGLGPLGGRVDRVIEEARRGAAGQGALEQVQAGLRVATAAARRAAPRPPLRLLAGQVLALPRGVESINVKVKKRHLAQADADTEIYWTRLISAAARLDRSGNARPSLG
jgi:hypothetical protein